MKVSEAPTTSLRFQKLSTNTHLGGELADFNLHTLQTTIFDGNARIDAIHWRKLAPFDKRSDEEMATDLVNESWINDVLMRDWILMRWNGTQNLARRCSILIVLQSNAMSNRQIANPPSLSVASVMCQ